MERKYMPNDELTRVFAVDNSRLPSADDTAEIAAQAEQNERDLIDMFGKRKPAIPPLPSYVAHAPEVDEVGRVSSEVLVQSYEASAKAFEVMARTLTEEMAESEKQTLELVRFLEQTKKETEEAVKRCNEAAKSYRAEAAEMFRIIQGRSILAAKVRHHCSSMIEEIKGNPEIGGEGQ